MVDRSRLMIDARKWLASKLAPKKYGDKVSAELSGPDGGPIQESLIVEYRRGRNGRPQRLASSTTCGSEIRCRRKTAAPALLNS